VDNKWRFKLIAIIVFFPACVFALPKTVTLKGLVIFNQEYVIRAADIDTIPASRFTFETIAQKITKFYNDIGYTLATVQLEKETPASIILYVDEGRLNRIIFKRLNTLDTLRIQYDFNLPHRIYHKPTVEMQLTHLKKKYAIKDIVVTIQPSRDYSNSLFQIDRLREPFNTNKLPIIPVIPITPDPRYDLILTVIPYTAEEIGGIRWGFDTSLRRGLIPYIQYTHNDVFQKHDAFKVGFRTGFMYGINGNFSSPPSNTFNEIKSMYNFKPYFRDLFIPQISSKIYHSKTGRKDLGLDQYNYIMMSGLIEPGFIPIERLKVYPGYGVEKVFIFKVKEDPDSDEVQPDINKKTQVWQFIGIEANLDLIPFSLKQTTKRKLRLTLRRYSSDTHFYMVTIDALFQFEFANYDLFLLQMDYRYTNNNVPFYYEEPVSSKTFKGFMTKDYYSTHIARTSGEYQVSVYRDFVYMGVYNDITLFKGKHILSGNQFGIAYGLSFHYIFFEQFEFALWWGKDYLFSNQESQFNFKFSLSKKW